VTCEEWFDSVRTASPDLPTWVGELYLETHRGTYTTQSAIKRANRKNELALREAEIFAAAAAITAGAAWPAADLHAAWENLLLLQFHDILPGSSIAEVYREALADHTRIEATAHGARDAAIRALAGTAPRDTPPKRASAGLTADGILAFNSLPWERRDAVDAVVPDVGTDDLEVAWSDADPVPAQVIGRSADGVCIVFTGAPVPSVGWTWLSVGKASAPAALSLRVQDRTVETGFFVIEVGDDGTLTRLYDKRHAREVVPPGGRANDLQLFQDGPEREAAWNMHATFERRRYDWDSVAVSVVERGPVRAVVRVVRRHRSSVVEQDVVAWAGLDRIDFVTRADWQERQVLLKAAFPLAVRTEHAAYEIQFGAVERPTHRNTSWDAEKFEVCGHRWADLSEAGYGVTLLNDSRYGHDAHGNVLRLTLLRGSEWPDPDADRGRHEFTYALLPHAGDWRTGATVRGAWELNVPVTCVTANGNAAGAALAGRSFLAIDGPAVLEAFKQAENGDGWVLRLSEPHGGRGRVAVRVPRPLARVESCNHAEEGGEPVEHDGAAFHFPINPFEVKTFRLRFG
jgi:alpha-mannosidase